MGGLAHLGYRRGFSDPESPQMRLVDELVGVLKDNWSKAHRMSAGMADQHEFQRTCCMAIYSLSQMNVYDPMAWPVLPVLRSVKLDAASRGQLYPAVLRSRLFNHDPRIQPGPQSFQAVCDADLSILRAAFVLNAEKCGFGHSLAAVNVLNKIKEFKLKEPALFAGLPSADLSAEHSVSGSGLMVDLAFPALKIALEVDGAYHTNLWEGGSCSKPPPSDAFLGRRGGGSMYLDNGPTRAKRELVQGLGWQTVTVRLVDKTEPDTRQMYEDLRVAITRAREALAAKQAVGGAQS